MVRVPTYDNFQVSPNTLPQVSVQQPDMPDIAGRQLQQTGQAMGVAGQQVGEVALDLQQQANQLRLDDAMNQAKEEALRLTFDTDAGYSNLHGINALERPDGRPLTDEYSDLLQQRISQISEGLGNDAQRRAFAQAAGGMLTNFRGQLLKHEADEFQTYALSVAEGVQATALREIGLHWNNPEITDKAILRIQAQTYRQAQLLGMSAEWQEAQARKLISGAHKLAMTTALENNNPMYADAYLKKYSKDMSADDILAVQKVLTGEVDLQVAGSAAGAVLEKYSPRLHTSDAERAFHILLGTESNHRQFDDDGNPLTSSAGAVGIAQVMPGTAKAAAKLAGLEWDEHKYKTDPNYNRALGLAHFQKQLQDFGGDLAKTYAAYNAGEGWVQKAVARAKKADPGTQEADWFWQLNNDGRTAANREQTRNYVEKNMREFTAGMGRAPTPTLAEMKADLRSDPRLASNPSRLKSAETILEGRHKDMTAARKQADDDAVDGVLRELYANGGRLDAVPASMRSAVPGDKLSGVMDFAAKVAKNGGAVHNPEVWASILSLPNDMLPQTPLDFYQQYRPYLDDAHLEKGYALVAGAKGGATDKQLEIITTANRVKDAAIIAGFLPESGKPNKEEVKQFSQFQRTVETELRTFEQVDLQGKRKANGQELQQVIDRVLMDKVFLPQTFWSGRKEKILGLMSPEDQANAYVMVDGERVKISDIPPSQGQRIGLALRQTGEPVTAENIAREWVLAGRPE